MGKAAPKKTAGKGTTATKNGRPGSAVAERPSSRPSAPAKPAAGKGAAVAGKTSPAKPAAKAAAPAKAAPVVAKGKAPAAPAKAAAPAKPAAAPAKPAAAPAKPVAAAKADAKPAGKPTLGKVEAKPTGKPGQTPTFKPKPGVVYITPGAGLKNKPVEASKSAKPAKAEAAPAKVDRPSGPTLQMLEPASSADDGKPKKNQAGLSVKELQFFRDLLLEKRRELVGDMSNMEREALQSGDSGLSTLPMHMADMGTDNYEQEFTLGLVEKDRVLLREINHALAKIQNGTYGICEGNGKPIAKVRLEAQPWARHSIEFARANEKGPIRR